MYQRPYRRPFSRAVPLLRSRAAGGPTLAVRAMFLGRGYRRALGVAAIASILAHGLFWLLGPESEPYRPRPIIGYEGPTRVMAIRVVDPEAAQESLAEERRRSGALVASKIRTDQEREESAPRDPFELERNEPTELAEKKYYVVQAPPSVAKAEPDAPIRVELREDLTVSTSSSASAQSLDIKLIWVVRPEYPTFARKNGIEGLVRLEAEIGITGKVLDVHVLETPDGGLALAASRSLLLWEFQPLSVNGRLRKFRVVVPFRFTLLG